MKKSLGFLLLMLLSWFILVTSEKYYKNDTEDQPDEELTFQEFKVKFKKSYKNSQQVENRKSAYRGNIQKLKNADCGACGITSFFDKNEDQRKKMRGLDSEKPDDFNMKDNQDDSQNDKQKESLRKNKNSTEVPNVGLAYTASTPTSTTQTLSTTTIISTDFDWRKMGMITPVKQQGECKACWAFATVSMFESTLIRKGLASNLTADLSEQYLIQWDTSSSGSKRGNPKFASKFVALQGIPRESTYEYNYSKSYPGICTNATQYSFNTSQYNVYFKTTRMSDASIISQLVVRPLIVYVTSTYWQFYKPIATNRIFTCRSTESLQQIHLTTLSFLPVIQILNGSPRTPGELTTESMDTSTSPEPQQKTVALGSMQGPQPDVHKPYFEQYQLMNDLNVIMKCYYQVYFFFIENWQITKSEIQILQLTISITNLKRMEEGVPKPKVPTFTYRPTKYFISSLNTHLGHVLVNRLRNQSVHPQNPNSIIGTLVTQKQKLEDKYNFTPEGVRKVIETDKVQFFHDVLLNSDAIIYDLNTCNLDEAESAISALKISEYTQNKTLICISNVMTWAKSKPKQKKQGEEEEDENPVQQPDSEQEGTEPTTEEGYKKPIVRFTQKDFNMRRPHPAYEKIKSMETLCIAAGTARANLKTYVICSGIIYGAGQNLFRQYFMQARLQKPQALSVYGKGRNRIPTVHLYDLVTYIQQTIEKKPQIPYILALDQNPKPTQKKIIQAISKGIGTGRVVHVPVESTVKNIDMLTLNLRMKPCMFFAKLQAEDEAKQPEEGVQLVKFKFNWSAKEGIQKNIEKLRQQFNQNLGLKQEKIFIMGPPGCGKSYFAKGLSKKYNLPHLHINHVIQWVKSLQTQLGEQIRNAFNEKKQAEIAAKQQEYEASKQKWKKIPKELRQPLEPFNPDKVVVKLPDELVYKCYLERLRQNDCLNRGYILDGYPKKYQDSVQLFMELPTPAEGEEPDENAKKILNKSLAPTKFILLEQSDEEILERLQKLPEQTITGTHFTQKQAKRRLKIYRDLMNSSTGDFVLSDFFTEQNQISQHKIEIHNINVTDQTEALLQSIVKPITVSQIEEHALVNQIIEREKQRKQKIREEMTRKQEIVRNIQAEDYRMKKQNEQNEERQILDKKSLALRKYLDVNLVPILSEGIFQILKQFPKDPVDRLAEFLFKNSLKVPNPDPSTFEF